ncbi:MAG: glutathione S-transferase N-terminal domain-containing protein [Pseudomonadota bacterium]|jgi:RNA polymerase-associated protein|nr:glutathione S-transferase N-terminal domain-containing protein [Pseudomonadota bacterium]MDE3142478.1 glutathione S-transferase N-terminal domain-containing protein [Pseudomonadota bacterium]
MAQNPRMRNVLTLYTLSDDIQCHRVRLVLAAKGVAYERELVDPSKPPAELSELNPYASAPTLIDRDLTLYETSVICEYIDERFPHPPLMPIDPQSRARLRLVQTRVEREWLPMVAAIEGGGRHGETGRRQLRESLLASVPLFKMAKFLLNPEISLADCLVAPLIWRLPALGIDLPRSAAPVIDYGERLFASQGFARSLTASEKALRQ